MGGLTGAMPSRSSQPAVFYTGLSRRSFCLCVSLLRFGALDQWAAFSWRIGAVSVA